MSNKRKKHTHKFLRVNRKYVKIWKCALPDCNYFIHASMDAIILGKRSICWECDSEFTIDENNLDEDNPTCLSCDLKKTGIEPIDIEALIKSKIDENKKKE